MRLRDYRDYVIHQGTYVEATVVQMPNQGTIPKKGCNLFHVSFFGYFFGQAKKVTNNYHNLTIPSIPDNK